MKIPQGHAGPDASLQVVHRPTKEGQACRGDVGEEVDIKHHISAGADCQQQQSQAENQRVEPLQILGLIRHHRKRPATNGEQRHTGRDSTRGADQSSCGL